MNLRQQMNFILHAGNVQRFHTLPTLKGQTVGHHSFGVAWMCYLLTNGAPTADLLMAALSHDAAEQTVGDIPSPSKKILDTENKLSAMEADILSDFGLNVVLTPREEAILKMADILDGMLFCMSERHMGNRFISSCMGRYAGYARKFLESDMFPLFKDDVSKPSPYKIAVEMTDIIEDQWRKCI